MRKGRRKAPPPKGKNRVMKLSKHGASYQLWTWPGKVQSSMAAGKPYEAALLEHIYEQGFTGVAVDGGANLGNHSLWFAVICDLDVVAFEPVHWVTLRKNVDLNRMHDKIRIERHALTNDPDVSLAHIGKGRLIESSSDNPGGAVTSATLDSYRLEDVALIKLDVEGMEPSALLGAEETILDQHPALYTEVWGDTELEVIRDIVTPWGYTLTQDIRNSPSADTRMIEWRA